jgi:putative acetyltransferase
MSSLVIGIEDPRSDEVRAVLERHLAFANTHTPPEGVHALDLSGLLDPAVTLFGARLDSRLMAVGAIKELDDTHGELKSMHTIEEARGQGIGRAMVEHLLGVARERHYERVSLETGFTDAFIPAHALYARCGFAPCPPFGDYVGSPTSACMTLLLD